MPDLHLLKSFSNLTAADVTNTLLAVALPTALAVAGGILALRSAPTDLKGKKYWASGFIVAAVFGILLGVVQLKQIADQRIADSVEATKKLHDSEGREHELQIRLEWLADYVTTHPARFSPDDREWLSSLVRPSGGVSAKPLEQKDKTVPSSLVPLLHDASNGLASEMEATGNEVAQRLAQRDQRDMEQRKQALIDKGAAPKLAEEMTRDSPTGGDARRRDIESQRATSYIQYRPRVEMLLKQVDSIGLQTQDFYWARKYIDIACLSNIRGMTCPTALENLAKTLK